MIQYSELIKKLQEQNKIIIEQAIELERLKNITNSCNAVSKVKAHLLINELVREIRSFGTISETEI